MVGTGTIGASWAAYFLARGFDVRATDPADGAEHRLRESVAQAWPLLVQLPGFSANASLDRLQFFEDLEEALDGASFVQESGPERLEEKRALFARLDALAPEHVILATSSSGLPMSQIQTACCIPGRCIVGHPFNPPHILPLVEVVPGAATSDSVVEQAMAFYAGIGKRPVHVRKECAGYIANRLQAALWREAAYLAESGVASVDDIDTAVKAGPGLRWALMGPTTTFHLAGGHGGLEHFLNHLGPSVQQWWDDLGHPVLNSQLQELLVAGLAGKAPVADLIRERDQLLPEIVRISSAGRVL